MLADMAIISDYLEERWPSMDLVADMLAGELSVGHADICVRQLRPVFVRRFTRARVAGENRHLVNADRLLNRFVDYPRFLKHRTSELNLFHIVVHSYSHLVKVAGRERSVVTCHDLDAFRPAVEPNGNANAWLLGKMARAILEGFGKAAAIACDSAATRDDLLRHRLAPPAWGARVRSV
jgi:hypothetical protein